MSQQPESSNKEKRIRKETGLLTRTSSWVLSGARSLPILSLIVTKKVEDMWVEIEENYAVNYRRKHG